MRLAIIINPISGAGGRADRARPRAEMAAALIERRRLDGEVLVTDRAGHARELTRAAVARGAEMVVAWGGDGTMNEVASVLAFTSTPLAIIPSGSGNGLARELGIPSEPEGALAVAIDGRSRSIDAGEMDGHLFFNIAGIGLDARVAHRFAAGGGGRRGLARYVDMTLRELLTYEPDEHTVTTESGVIRQRALLIAIANGRQYGNGAVIAPDARLDDGYLDVVVVAHRSVVEALFQMPRIFGGRVNRVRGISTRKTQDVEIASACPVVFHVDGEPFSGSTSIRAHVHAKALVVRVPLSD